MSIRHIGVLALFAAFLCKAQGPVAPTPGNAGPRRGDDWEGYNIVNSFETGYRFLSLSGNQNKYRSDENFGSGVRLLNSFFSMHSKDGHGALFDELVITTNGLGGDPYESVRVSAEKNRLYEYTFYWRKNDYFNPGLTTDGGASQHLLDTSYTLQDHDLTLFPKSPVKLLLGYSRNDQSGAGVSTVQLFNPGGEFDATGNIFPIFSNVNIVQNDFRLGGETHWHGFTFNVIRGWQGFKDDTPFQFSGPVLESPAGNPASLRSFLRSSPYHGTSPYWQVGLFHESRWFNWNGRFTYTGGNRTFLSNEAAIGINQFGALANQQIITGGDARRPVATGNFNITAPITSKLTITGSTSLYNVRTDGDSAYLQYDNATQSSDLLYFQYLGIRTFQTNADALYQARSWLDLHAGYLFSDRRIASTPQVVVEGLDSPIPFEQTNQLHSGVFGFRARPIKGLILSFDGEIGRATRPFTPKSDADYNTISGSLRYNLKHLRLTALAHTDYNLNSVSLSSYSSHGRTYSASASWLVGSWLSLDAAYTKIHLDTLGGIAFFEGPQFRPDQVSSYISNINSGTLSLRVSHKRVSFFAGYSHVQDTGDGRSAVTETIVGPSLAAFQTAQTFPIRFLSPMARLSVRINERLLWNVGYQYYGYHESFTAGGDYLAHTGYSSLTWSF
jgi:hypothetical protein